MRAQLISLALAAAAAAPAVVTTAPAEAGFRVVRGPAPRVVVTRARPSRHVVVVAGRPAGLIDFNVRPKATEIWVNGGFRGACADFDGHPQKMALRPGTHRIKLVTPGGRTFYREVSVVAGYEVNLNLDL